MATAYSPYAMKVRKPVNPVTALKLKAPRSHAQAVAHMLPAYTGHVKVSTHVPKIPSSIATHSPHVPKSVDLLAAIDKMLKTKSAFQSTMKAPGQTPAKSAFTSMKGF